MTGPNGKIVLTDADLSHLAARKFRRQQIGQLEITPRVREQIIAEGAKLVNKRTAMFDANYAAAERRRKLPDGLNPYFYEGEERIARKREKIEKTRLELITELFYPPSFFSQIFAHLSLW